MQVHRGRRRDVGLQRISVQQQHQAGALVEVVGDRALPHKLAGLRHERRGEIWPIERRGTWHSTPPATESHGLPLRFPASLPATQPYR